MVHQPSASFYGQAADIARHAQEIVKLKRRLNEIYAKHTGQTVEAIEKLLDRDTYMTGRGSQSFRPDRPGYGPPHRDRRSGLGGETLERSSFLWNPWVGRT